jgi:hypothetical protein
MRFAAFPGFIKEFFQSPAKAKDAIIVVSLAVEAIGASLVAFAIYLK